MKSAEAIVSMVVLVLLAGGGSMIADQWHVSITRPWRRRRKRLARERRDSHALEKQRTQAAIDAARPARPICQCGHGLAFHDRATDHCADQSPDGTPCRCRRYIGPEPLPAFYAPDLADPDSAPADE